MKLVLASTSAIRRQVLLQAGLTIIVEPPDVDERALSAKSNDTHPEQLAALLAEAKAISVANRIGSGIVIGADQILSCDGNMLSKPSSIANASAQLSFLRHRRHTLTSAVCCVRGNTVAWSHVSRAELTMRNFSDAFLETYLQEGGADLLSSVGAYKLEGRGVQLFDAINGDYFTILGLPLIPLLDFLRRDGAIPS